jgi:hypothetical protein
MSDWLTLNPAALNKARHEQIRGVEVQVLLSPYDVPEAVRGYYDRHIRRFVIEFRYISGDESLIPDAQDEHITLKIGRNSHRLYRIEIDVDRLKAPAVALKLVHAVDQAIDRLVQRSRRSPREGNYEVAKEVILERGNELFQSLHSAS